MLLFSIFCKYYDPSIIRKPFSKMWEARYLLVRLKDVWNIGICFPLEYFTFNLFLTSQVYSSETGNDMKTTSGMLESNSHLHSQVFRYTLLSIIFDDNSFSKAGKKINVLSTQKNVLKPIALSANKIAQYAFSRQLLETTPREEQWSASLDQVFYQQQVSKKEILK